MAVRFNYTPHEAQRLIHEARGYRFRVVCTGRRFGKTLCLAAELLDRGGTEQCGDYGWIAPTYNVADRGIEAFRSIAEGFIKIVGRAPTRVEFKGKHGRVRVWFLSADNPDNIRGFGFQGLVIDEAASIPVSVWHYVLRPTIAQTLGWAVFVSTPKGRNWFFDLYTRGLDAADRDYKSFSFPSSQSPYFPVKEWEEAKRSLPDDVFRQEYEAQFLEDSAGVFRGIERCLVNAREVGGGRWEVEGSEYHRSVVIGCDVAKHTDFTVLIAMDPRTGICFAMERFNHLDWPIQKERIVAFGLKHRGRIILDATGAGDPIYDDLKRVYPDIEPFRFSAGSKVELVQRLVVAVEQRQVSWPCGVSGSEGAAGQWDVLVNEMKRFEYVISSTGNITYSAPEGYHDDCVMALALANHGRWEQGRTGMFRVLDANGSCRKRVRRSGERVIFG